MIAMEETRFEAGPTDYTEWRETGNVDPENWSSIEPREILNRSGVC